MFVHERRGSFQLENNFAVANEIGLIRLQERASAIAQGQDWLRDGWDALMLELDLQTFLINWFEKPAALLVIYLEASANDRVTFFFVNDFRHQFAWIRVIRGHW